MYYLMAIRSAGRRHQAMQICPAAKSSVHVGLGTWSWGLLCSSLSSVQFARPAGGARRAGDAGRDPRPLRSQALPSSSHTLVSTRCTASGTAGRVLLDDRRTYPVAYACSYLPLIPLSGPWKSLVKLSRLFAGVPLGGVDCCDHHPGNRAGTCIAVSGLASGMCISARQVCWNAGEMALARIEMRYLFQA